MAKTLIFSKPVEKRLKELKLKTIVTKRIYEHWKSIPYNYERRQTELKFLKSKTNLYDFISWAFYWDHTIEGKQYWFKIALKGKIL